jgi:hypothetical protein
VFIGGSCFFPRFGCATLRFLLRRDLAYYRCSSVFIRGSSLNGLILLKLLLTAQGFCATLCRSKVEMVEKKSLDFWEKSGKT